MEKRRKLLFAAAALILVLVIVIAPDLLLVPYLREPIVLFILLFFCLPWLIVLALLFLNACANVLPRMEDRVFPMTVSVLAAILLLSIIVGILYVSSAYVGAAYANLIAINQNNGANIVGGVAYFISSSFPIPAPVVWGGVGGYGQYLTYLATHTAEIGSLQLPEAVHAIGFALAILALTVLMSWLITGRRRKSDSGSAGSEFGLRESVIAAAFAICGVLLGIGYGFAMLLYLIYKSGYLPRKAKGIPAETE